jgi:H/ACA ribonucleoprotein complex subunit 2
MAKEKTEGDVKAKKEKREKKEKRSEEDGVSKKSKKEKKRKSKEPTGALLNHLESGPDSVAAITNGDIPQTKFDEQPENDEPKEIVPRRNIPPEALVPFANPLADDKQTKKIFKSVQKGG